MIYVEPTPYIVALIDTLRHEWTQPIEVLYITNDASQPWNIEVESLNDNILPNKFLPGMAAIWKALQRNRQCRVILHLAGWGHPILLGAMLMGCSVRIPVAVESDSSAGRKDVSWRGLIKRLLYPLLFRLPARFLPGGTRQVRYLESFGVTEDRMTVAQMTVDVEAIRGFCAQDRSGVRSATRTQWAMSADDRVVLYVGRLEQDKGIDLLLTAFERAVAEDNKLRLVIAGAGSLESRVRAAANGRVVYLGRLSGKNVLRAYIAADFVVLPSRFEPWGLVVNEAMACGLPVIVSDRVGCADDLVRSGETGLVIAAEDEIGLTTALVRLARDKAERYRMGQAARRLISNWTLRNEAHNITSAWETIAQ